MKDGVGGDPRVVVIECSDEIGVITERCREIYEERVAGISLRAEGGRSGE